MLGGVYVFMKLNPERVFLLSFKNILEYLNTKFKNRQIIIFTCTNREKNILENKNINYNYMEI